MEGFERGLYDSKTAGDGLAIRSYYVEHRRRVHVRACDSRKSSVEAGASSRTVYLPDAPVWYNFWSGEQDPGHRKLEPAAPIDRMPLYVRAGSILPLGPETEYADQNANGPIELRIYKGANGEFDLYEDSGDGYEYERGQHSIIRIRWNDQSGVLTIGTREGTFPGLVGRRMFRLVLVGNGHGIGEETTDKVDSEVTCDGKEIRIDFGQHLLL